MIFTNNQIAKILSIIERNSIVYSISTLGKDAIPQQDIDLLRLHGIRIEDIEQEWPEFVQSFYFGRLSQLIGHMNAKKLSYNDFIKYLNKGQYIPLNTLERDMLQIAKRRTYGHIKKLASDQTRDLGQFIAESEQKVISSTIKAGVKNREALGNISNDISKKLNDWQRDMGRLVDTEYNNVFQEGRAADILRKDGEDALVYKDVYEGACQHCLRLYTTEGIGSKPRVFKLKDLIANGTNIRRKIKDWLATLGGIHPWCRCTLRRILKGQEWNEETKRFEYPETKGTRLPENLRGKAKITIGDKVMYV